MAATNATPQTPTRKKRQSRRSKHPEGLKDPLIFVDTNIFLDYYRARNEMQRGLLDRLEGVKERLVMTYQVEMEFKKRRLDVVANEGFDSLKFDTTFSPLAFLAKSKSVDAVKKQLKGANDRIKKMRKRVKEALQKPTSRDPIYVSSQRLFHTLSQLNLCRKNVELYKNADRIRRLALKRWMLGYPPRKSNDTSIGDAVNWEWIVDCAKRTNRDIIIVSRDSDYGVTVEGESFINDWLLSEFRERVSKQGRVRLTTKLSTALGWLEMPVSKEEQEGEDRLIASSESVLHEADVLAAERRLLAWQEQVRKSIDNLIAASGSQGSLLEAAKRLRERTQGSQ
jgi:predicted nucleic acid-binding protein